MNHLLHGEPNPADLPDKETCWMIYNTKNNAPISDEYFDTEKEAKKELEKLENIDKRNFVFIPYTYVIKEVEL